MRHLWTPWRLEFIRGPKPQECVFCAKLQGDDDQEHILVRGEHVYVTLNKYPYNNGHLLVVPYAHVPSVEDLDDATLLELMHMTNRALKALRATMNPHGFNIGFNIGAEAGAGVREHVHLHIVPRWAADSNFMTVLAGTRTIPQLLDDTYRELKAHWPDAS